MSAMGAMGSPSSASSSPVMPSSAAPTSLGQRPQASPLCLHHPLEFPSRLGSQTPVTPASCRGHRPSTTRRAIQSSTAQPPAVGASSPWSAATRTAHNSSVAAHVTLRMVSSHSEELFGTERESSFASYPRTPTSTLLQARRQTPISLDQSALRHTESTLSHDDPLTVPLGGAAVDHDHNGNDSTTGVQADTSSEKNAHLDTTLDCDALPYDAATKETPSEGALQSRESTAIPILGEADAVPRLPSFEAVDEGCRSGLPAVRPRRRSPSQLTGGGEFADDHPTALPPAIAPSVHSVHDVDALVSTLSPQRPKSTTAQVNSCNSSVSHMDFHNHPSASFVGAPMDRERDATSIWGATMPQRLQGPAAAPLAESTMQGSITGMHAVSPELHARCCGSALRSQSVTHLQLCNAAVTRPRTAISLDLGVGMRELPAYSERGSDILWALYRSDRIQHARQGEIDARLKGLEAMLGDVLSQLQSHRHAPGETAATNTNSCNKIPAETQTDAVPDDHHHYVSLAEDETRENEPLGAPQVSSVRRATQASPPVYFQKRNVLSGMDGSHLDSYVSCASEETVPTVVARVERVRMNRENRSFRKFALQFVVTCVRVFVSWLSQIRQRRHANDWFHRISVLLL